MGTHTPEQRAASAQRLRENRFVPPPGYTFKKKEQGPPITMERALRAIVGSCGINKRVAKRLGVSLSAWKAKLKLPDWSDARKALEEEREALVDEAEATVRDIMNRKKDRRRFDAAKLVLGTQGGWHKQVVVSGGDKPLQIAHALVDVDSLPVEARRALLESVEKVAGSAQFVEVGSSKLPTITITVRRKKA